MLKLLPLLPPLLLLLLLPLAQSQAPPKIDNYFDDILIRINFTKDTSAEIKCPTTISGFIGISNRDNSQIVNSAKTFSVDLSYSKGIYDSLQNARQKLGAYHCLYRDGTTVKAYSIILSEKPERVPQFDRRELRNSGGSAKQSIICKANGTDVVWEKYQDDTGLFIPHLSGSRTILFSYTILQQNQSSGFTVYRCYEKSKPEKIFYHEARKPASMEIRTFRTSNYVSSLLPKFVRPGKVISLECHGKRGIDRDVEIFFRPKKKLVYKQIDCANTANVSCIVSDVQTQLKIAQFQPKHIGKYYCVKDGIIQRAKLLVDPGDVIIKQYSKYTYTMAIDNTIRCMPSDRSLGKNLRYVLKLKSGRQIVIKPGQTKEGYKAELDEDNDLLLKFPLKKEAIGATLECHLHYEYDYIYIDFKLPTIELTGKASGGWYQLECKIISNETIRTAPVLHVLLANGSIGKVATTSDSLSAPYEYSDPVPREYTKFVCVLKYRGVPARSNALGFGKISASLNIFVEGEKNPAAKVLLEGRDIRIECSFEKLTSGTAPVPAKLTLFKNGKALRGVAQQAINDTAFRYVLLRASPSDSGIYQCAYNASQIVLIKSAPIAFNLNSINSSISLCTTSQFICDSSCKNRSLMCDGKVDCVDKSDERPEYCNKCEPNQIRCEIHNGTQPKKKCVLKHWLCDGQDDCGNGFDENIAKQGKWCYKESDCTGCKPQESCCPHNKTQCILRSYECDGESDCKPRTEEKDGCKKDNCLEITTPQKRTVVTKKVGDTDLAMECVATGSERPTINWRRNWAAVPANVTESNSVLGRPATTGVYVVQGKLTFASITKEMAGIYNCEAVNNCKRLMSNEIELKVE